MTLTADQIAAYDAARERAAFYPVPHPGHLWLAGPDRVTFIQRQTTNDVRTLAPGRALLTVLTSPTARVLDVWRLVMDGPETIGAITLPGQAARIAAFLRTRIFFMDKVTLTEANAIAQVDLLGPEAPGSLAALGFTAAPEPDAVLEAPFSTPGGEVTLRAIGPNLAITRAIRLIVPHPAAESLIERLRAAGALPLDDAAAEVLRIEAGLPAAGRELTEEYTPLEARLEAAISEAKGCYTGQEIIARQLTYDKVTRRLAGLRLDRPGTPGAAISVEGRTVGAITSAAASPRLGPIALAVLKRPHHEPGAAVVVADEAGPIAGQVIALG